MSLLSTMRRAPTRGTMPRALHHFLKGARADDPQANTLPLHIPAGIRHLAWRP